MPKTFPNILRRTSVHPPARGHTLEVKQDFDDDGILNYPPLPVHIIAAPIAVIIGIATTDIGHRDAVAVAAAASSTSPKSPSFVVHVIVVRWTASFSRPMSRSTTSAVERTMRRGCRPILVDAMAELAIGESSSSSSSTTTTTS
jgi:hypothetical protein